MACTPLSCYPSTYLLYWQNERTGYPRELTKKFEYRNRVSCHKLNVGYRRSSLTRAALTMGFLLVGSGEVAPAMPAQDYALQQGATFAHRTTHFTSRIGGKTRFIGVERIPGDIRRVRILQQRMPLLALASRIGDAPRRARADFGSSIRVRVRIARIVQNPQRQVTRQGTPGEFPFIRPLDRAHRKGHAFAVEVAHHAFGGTEAPKHLEKQADRLLYLPIGIQFDVAAGWYSRCFPALASCWIGAHR